MCRQNTDYMADALGYFTFISTARINSYFHSCNFRLNAETGFESNVLDIDRLPNWKQVLSAHVRVCAHVRECVIFQLSSSFFLFISEADYHTKFVAAAFARLLLLEEGQTPKFIWGPSRPHFRLIGLIDKKLHENLAAPNIICSRISQILIRYCYLYSLTTFCARANLLSKLCDLGRFIYMFYSNLKRLAF